MRLPEPSLTPGDSARRAARALFVVCATLLVGCDARVEMPDLLWLLWLGPALCAFYVYSFAARRRLLEQFASREMIERLCARLSHGRQYLKAVLLVTAVLALVMALAGFQYGFTWEEVRRRGVDVVIALDVSDSMLVEDSGSDGLTRLERAKREIADLLNVIDGDRIGLVAFAGTAFLELPLTLDHSAALLFLDAMDTDLIPTKGTSLAQALTTSLQALESSPQTSKAVILITDGEDHEGEVLEVAEQAREASVRVFVIGIGQGEGSPIPRAGGGVRRDAAGEVILSRLDEPTLQKIALATGGRYVRSVTGDLDLEQIYTQGIKASLEDQELGARRRQRFENRFQWWLGLALCLLMIEPLLSERRSRRVTPTALEEHHDVAA